MPNKTLRQRYVARKAWGLLASIDLAGCDHDLIQSPTQIKKFVRQLIKSIKMEAYGPTHLKKFGADSLEGYSVFQFIETSSVVVHFDDKMGDRAFIDIFSCKFFDPEVAARFAKQFFQARSARTKVLLRY